MEDLLRLWENESHGTSIFQPEERTSQNSTKRNGGNGEHKVNMVELNSNSFRLDSSFPIVNSITFSSDWWLDSRANIHICTDAPGLNPIRNNIEEA